MRPVGFRRNPEKPAALVTFLGLEPFSARPFGLGTNEGKSFSLFWL